MLSLTLLLHNVAGMRESYLMEIRKSEHPTVIVSSSTDTFVCFSLVSMATRCLFSFPAVNATYFVIARLFILNSN